MAAGKVNIKHKQGDYFHRQWTWKVKVDPEDPESELVAVNLSGYSAKIQVREAAGETGAADLEFSTAAGTIVLGGAAGTIVVTDSTTENWVVGRYKWELELTAPSGAKRTLLQGSWVVEAQVTIP